MFTTMTVRQFQLIQIFGIWAIVLCALTFAILIFAGWKLFSRNASKRVRVCRNLTIASLVLSFGANVLSITVIQSEAGQKASHANFAIQVAAEARRLSLEHKPDTLWLACDSSDVYNQAKARFARYGVALHPLTSLLHQKDVAHAWWGYLTYYQSGSKQKSVEAKDGGVSIHRGGSDLLVTDNFETASIATSIDILFIKLVTAYKLDRTKPVPIVPERDAQQAVKNSLWSDIPFEDLLKPGSEVHVTLRGKRVWKMKVVSEDSSILYPVDEYGQTLQVPGKRSTEADVWITNPN